MQFLDPTAAENLELTLRLKLFRTSKEPIGDDNSVPDQIEKSMKNTKFIVEYINLQQSNNRVH